MTEVRVHHHQPLADSLARARDDRPGETQGRSITLE